MIDKLIPWGISALSLMMVILAYFRDGANHTESEHKEEVEATKHQEAVFAEIEKSLLKVNIKLDQLCATTNETRSDIKSLNKDLQGLDKRVSIIERDLETAFNLIDQIQNK